MQTLPPVAESQQSSVTGRQHKTCGDVLKTTACHRPASPGRLFFCGCNRKTDARLPSSSSVGLCSMREEKGRSLAVESRAGGGAAGDCGVCLSRDQHVLSASPDTEDVVVTQAGSPATLEAVKVVSSVPEPTPSHIYLYFYQYSGVYR